ncbi:MAG: N-acyl homoserine lactonase family protein [Chloroflexota bacterium]
MKIHAIETGRVKITKNWQVGQDSGLGRLANTLLDRRFTAWLPIYCWVVEHPEGLLVIDTGIPADANKPIFFPPFMPLVQRAAKFDIEPSELIGPQMLALGLEPEAVRWVVQTHLHQDHDGGLGYFPNAEIIVSRVEWETAVGVKGRLGGYLNHRWPKWLQPSLVEFEAEPLASFASHYTLTEAGDVILVPTPGHSQGHLSVIVKDGDLSYLFAGDVSYTEQHLLNGTADGVAVAPEQQLDTQKRIVAYAQKHPTVYLPSHDPEGKQRLESASIVPVYEASRSKVG